jgi:ligand-binding SRPBCC domain-containing protein
MPHFAYSFTINAPKAIVRDFHHDPRVLKQLTPPPLFVQVHEFEPLAEGSRADFTIWFGPFPVRWQAIHSQVDEGGFTDTMDIGPLKEWQHRHQFVTVNNDMTEVRESIEYEYKKGVQGVVNRLMYSRAPLTFLFTARKFITRRQIKTIMRSKNVRN